MLFLRHFAFYCTKKGKENREKILVGLKKSIEMVALLKESR